MRNFNRHLTYAIHKAVYYSTPINFIFLSFLPFLLIYGLTCKEIARIEFLFLYQAVFSSFILAFFIAGIINPIFSGYIGKANYYKQYNGVFIWIIFFLGINFGGLLLTQSFIAKLSFFVNKRPFFILSGMLSAIIFLTGYFHIRNKYMCIMKASLYGIFVLFLYLLCFQHNSANIIYGYEIFLATNLSFLVFYAYRIDRKIHKYLTDFFKLFKAHLRLDKLIISLLLALLWLPEKLIIFNDIGIEDFRKLIIAYTIAFLLIFPIYYYLNMQIQSYFMPFAAKESFFKKICYVDYANFLKMYKDVLIHIEKIFNKAIVGFCFLLFSLFFLIPRFSFLEPSIIVFIVATFSITIVLFAMSLFHSFQFDFFVITVLSGYYAANIFLAVLLIHRTSILYIVAGNAIISIAVVFLSIFYFKKIKLHNLNNYLRRFPVVYPDFGVLQESYLTIEEKFAVERVRQYARNYIKKHKRR